MPDVRSHPRTTSTHHVPPITFHPHSTSQDRAAWLDATTPPRPKKIFFVVASNLPPSPGSLSNDPPPPPEEVPLSSYKKGVDFPR